MDYETFIKLKEAGYPIKDFGYAPDIWKGGGVSPTLSELMEEIAKKEIYFGIEKHSNDWRAGTLKTGGMNTMVFGSTPEIALSNLWLELNKGK